MTSNHKITPEEDLILRLCRLELSSEQVQDIKSVISSVTGWKYFTGRANAHGTGALVYHNLVKHDLLRYLPAQASDYLKNIMMLNLARNTSHISHMKEVLAILNSSGIKTILLKGLALELTIYGNRGIRQMTDVDILITGNDCIRARKQLMAKGFKSLPLKSPVHNLIIRYTGKHLPSLLKDDFSVEIHHSLFGGKGEELTDMLYNGSSEINLLGEKAYIPDSQLFFLYLVKHLAYHEMNNESQLRLYTDLVVILERYRDNVLNHELIVLWQKAGIERVLCEKLGLLREFWGISLPAWVDSYIYKWYTTEVSDKFLFFLGSPKGNKTVAQDIPYKYVVGEIPGMHRKILYVLGDLFPSVQFMKKRYNCNSLWKVLLHYPHRMGKLWYLIK